MAADTRANAHGVDLNRNYPYCGPTSTAATSPGREPASEPETRAMMGFLRQVRPDRLLSFHQPLNGVDTDTKRPASPAGWHVPSTCPRPRSTAAASVTAR